MRFTFYTVVSFAATVAHGIRLESEQNIGTAEQLLANAVNPIKPPMEITTDGGFNNFKFNNAHPEEVKKFMGQMSSQFGGGPPRPKCPQPPASAIVDSAETDSKIKIDKMKAESEKKEAAENVEREKKKA